MSAAFDESTVADRLSALPGHLSCGLLTGVVQAILFNPYDRALYLAIEKQRSFLSPLNWRIEGKSAMTGVWPSVLQRAVSFGLYFPLEGLGRGLLSPYASAGTVDACAGLIAGAANGLVTAPINAAKYAVWRDTHQPNSLAALGTAYEKGGARVLMRAAPATVSRDLTFGLVFSYLRHRGEKSGFFENGGAGFVATVVSAPFNYARLKQYAFDGKTAPSMIEVFKELGEQTRGMSWGDKTRFIWTRLNIGWGALRVSLGMAIGSQIYKTCAGGNHYSK